MNAACEPITPPSTFTSSSNSPSTSSEPAKARIRCACAAKSPHGTKTPSPPTSPHKTFSRFPCLRRRRSRRGLLALGLAVGLDRRDLLVDENEPLVLARDLRRKPRRQRPPVAGARVLELPQEVARERLGVADPLRVQERLDAIGVGGALFQQALAFAARALVVLLLRARHVHDGAGQ